jgi:hypothetical protein
MKTEINKIKSFFKRIPRVLAENAFFTSVCFIILSLILGSLIFYKYSILTQRANIDINEGTFKFQEKSYQDVLKIWQEREEEFNTADSEQHSNLFQGLPLTPTPTSTKTK